MWDSLIIGGHCATLAGGADGLGVIRQAALATRDGTIAWVGPEAELSGPAERLAHEVVDLKGAWLTPGLIDCHTHLIFASHRAHEWNQRLEGISYEQIAAAGGGILSTVRATRQADEAALAASAQRRLDSLTAQGVTSVEIKSGYGLTVDDELKMLSAAGRLTGARISRTLLAAHTVPPEYRDDRAAYVDLIISDLIPRVAHEGLAEAVDVFCETIGFTPVETEALLSAATRHGLKIKIHAEQLSDQGGAGLAARHGALSADHLEHVSPASIAAMAEAGTVAVLLPGAFYFLRETNRPPVQALREAGVPLAVATDCNPGTSPMTSPLLAMNMACTLFGLTPTEALAGFTREAARALGQQDRLGTLEVGKRADLAAWMIDEPAELAYWLGANPLLWRRLDGRPA